MKNVKLEYFKQNLCVWREELIIQKCDVEKSLLVTGEGNDIIDIANDSIIQHGRIPEINHLNFLINEINQALERIKNGSYGYCEATKELIEEKRLKAWPIARLSLEEQEKRERRAKLQTS